MAWIAFGGGVVLLHLAGLFSHALGEDFGRVADLTVMWPLATKRNLMRETPFIVELGNMPFEQQRQILFFICDRQPKGSASLISRIAGVVRGIVLKAVAGGRRVLLSGFKVG